MKRRVINILLSFLFSLTFILSLISLTLLNDNFVMMAIKSKGIISKVKNDINKELESNGYSYRIDDGTTEERINLYVEKRYSYKEDDITEEDKIINKHIFFMDKKNYHMISYGIYILTLIMIFITGNIFIKSKRLHDLGYIFLISAGTFICLYGIIYFNLDNFNFILKDILDVFNHFILGSAILLGEWGFIRVRKFKIKS